MTPARKKIIPHVSRKLTFLIRFIQFSVMRCLQMLKDCTFCSVSVPDDLSIEEREELLNIRRRKKELIDDIEVIDLSVRILRRLLQ